MCALSSRFPGSVGWPAVAAPLALLLLLAMLSIPAFAQEPPPQAAPTAEGVDYFETHIRPLLAKQCYACHSAKTMAQGGLYTDSREGLRKGGKSGVPGVVPGKPGDSLIILAVRGTNKDLKMPPGKGLPAEEVAKLEEWVKMGAPDPRDASAPIAVKAAYDWEKEKQHWAFQPLDPSNPPQVENQQWSKTPIDRFVWTKLQEHKLQPLGEADKRTLLRRLTYGLTGLPPTPRQTRQFLNDTAPDAFAKLIDRLLDSPAYGEHWGRRWLDVARYADTAGDASDYPVPPAWRYRNYVIASLQNDKPFDEFLREQIAGDLLPPATEEDREENIVATGYLALSRRFGQTTKEFYLTIDDTIDTLGKGVLGLSLGCARCHDHKFDPVPTTDYYALAGIFQSTTYAHAGLEHHPFPENYSALKEQDSQKLAKAQQELVDNVAELRKLRTSVNRDEATPEEKLAYAEIKEKVARQREKFPTVPMAYGVFDGKPVNAKVYVKGDPAIEGPEVPRGFLQILGGQKVPDQDHGSGRRQLAEWLTDPDNPLTARVIVNRVWAWHFGKGIVETVNDFGARGEKPTHPELLDYLAARFIQSGWSLKKLHREILLSRAWQTASGHNPENALKDPKNQFLWKFDRRRLSAEELRDSLLLASGDLDSTPGENHDFPAQGTYEFTQHRPFVAQYDSNKRSVYLMQQRIRRLPYMELFDGPDTNSVGALRQMSITALQALYLMNDEFVHDQADHLAVRVGMAQSDFSDRLGYAYQLLFARQPSPAEAAKAEKFIAVARATISETDVPEDQRSRQAWASLMRVLVSSNEFMYVD